MEGITVNQLMAMCQKQIKLGNGDKQVIMSSDDECNEYHQAWEGLFEGKELKDYVDPCQLCHCISSNMEDYVVLT